MKNLYVILILSIFSTSVFSQEVPLKDKFVKQGNGYYDNREGTVHLDMPYELEIFNPDYKTFAARNISSETLSIIMVFDRFNGVVSSEKLPIIRAVRAGETRRLFWLKPATTAAPDYNYNLYYYRGHANPVIE
ncbi:MAG: hypothetical protein HWE07_00655, partial [Cytophagia bacterium]|nr:hypothetical protein [Cytophagia bacterium]